MHWSCELKDEQATIAVANTFAQVCEPPLTLYFQGPLGAGKTTFIRAFLRALGVEGKIKSPSYAIVEPYHLADFDIYHLDLYRLAHVDELEMIGIREYFSPRSICCIEWPEHGKGVLPTPDMDFILEYQEQGRQLTLTAHTQRGAVVCEQLKENL